ncbi:3D domain-containing protein [Aneurinibacillus migulanus]|uniref:3D domain-containing protein n=1 Tax=Aneurinibacillus migulanus TaxID=47500 RepID=UPI000696FF1A|nr:3D domain-containing protein [Aneurinibacillus migulanus]MCP1354712.1 3D domain-containing protein [Aneurinibacillus migulanus]CEH31308.1 3D domain protein [Aneurinibacillus migulanus]
MRKNLHTSLFHSAKAFREYRRTLIVGCPIIGLFLLVYLINSLAETPQHPEKDGNTFSPTTLPTYRTSFYPNGEVSAKELVPLGLTPVEMETFESSNLVAQTQKSTNNRALNHQQKPARSAMAKVREGMVFTANASGYTGPGKTKSGTKVRPGVAAVDPDYIPLGTVLWVEGYGECRAEDIGGAIKGNAIDLAFSTKKEALDWGRKDVQVKVISVPE